MPKTVVVIPALNPAGVLAEYAQKLIDAGIDLVVAVDDGSAPEYRGVFDVLRAMPKTLVLVHEKNRGKGAALKTAFSYIKDNVEDAEIIVTADSDGQHLPADILKLSEIAGKLAEPALLLGSRDFSRPDIPPKSRFGNKLTTVIFRWTHGLNLPDTQTGLRAFPASLLTDMASVRGERYEYEMEMLIYAARKKLPVIVEPITTVYENNNEGTHFHPVRDSYRIYKVILASFFKYILSSCAATLVDLLIFNRLCAWVFPNDSRWLTLLAATLIARTCSACVNFMINRDHVFGFKGDNKRAAARYAVLAVGVLIVSSLCVYFITGAFSFEIRSSRVDTSFAQTMIKAVVDTVLFFLNYQLCRRWVFGEEKGDKQ
ncbi:MAG: bifunctional glycosyltransferase family 2/GtrA family protein [Eubacteriales bacterium]|nr:bifunctional glycosyltransferase family 2/GtrA family protein [Eubacteriales bacterium]MDD3881257.1 bifunctional glycosyltransferase family 2/GtrA family protein [Eubacteriales bacterium]MDD4512175.1 bifunctional glycosyltransferase family 2/GtrA family protein [Eubacteriales bacterium]